jgi:site-specific DNA-cytosine methylase
MRVLVACEYSSRVREAFRRRGHDAWSCDLLPAEDGSEFHLQCDVRYVPFRCNEWDLMIAFPPCTDLCVSGARWFPEKRANGAQQIASSFFLFLANRPVPRIAIENPVGIMSSVWREPDQIIQPWQFGHGETKATCLWLKGLPPLKPTNIVPGREPRVHRMSPGPDRWKERSRTYEGIAEAMAEQWGDYSDLVTQAESACA